MYTSIFALVLTTVVLFCPATQGIDCYSCNWSNPPVSGSQAACEASPTEDMLGAYPDYVDRQAPKFQPGQNVSSAEASAVATAIRASIKTAANKAGTKTDSAGSIGSSRTTYTIICMTSFLQLSIQGTSAEMVVREGFGLSSVSASSYVNTCASSYPPGLKEELEAAGVLPYITEKRFCYCNCDGCNKYPVTVTTNPPSDSRDCSSSASKFIIAYSSVLLSILFTLL